MSRILIIDDDYQIRLPLRKRLDGNARTGCDQDPSFGMPGYTPIVALSGTGLEDFRKSTTTEANCSIEKPFLTREMLRAVKDCLAEDNRS